MKRWRTTLIVVGVFAALLAYILLVEREREPPTTETDVIPSPTPAAILDLAAEDLRAIHIDDGTRALRLARVGEGWTVDARPADAYAIDWRIDQLAALQARLIVAEQIDDPATYGLDTSQSPPSVGRRSPRPYGGGPSLILSLELASGESERILLGRKTPDGTARYAQRVGDPRLYVVQEFYIEDYFAWLDQPPDQPTPTS